MSDGARPLDKGKAMFCDECDEAYREASRLNTSDEIGYCPTCFEKLMNGEIEP